MDDFIVTGKPNVKLDDVIGLDEEKQTLKELVILPLKFPDLFAGKLLPPLMHALLMCHIPRSDFRLASICHVIVLL